MILFMMVFVSCFNNRGPSEPDESDNDGVGEDGKMTALIVEAPSNAIIG